MRAGHTPEIRARISAYAKLQTGPRNPFYGKRHSVETKAKLAAAATGRLWSEAQKEAHRIGNAARSRGWFINTEGYRIIRTESGRWRAEHIVIVEKALGRRLKYGEQVHHVNGVKADNRNVNFIICTNSYHKWLHNEMARRYQREHFNA